jgi:leucyl/phenylalanyl-tRNA--protein transferase
MTDGPRSTTPSGARLRPDDLAGLVAALGAPQQSVGPGRWAMPSPDLADDAGFVAAGADLDVTTLLDAYRVGLFPMPVRRNVVGWWSPDPRGIVPLDGLIVSRSLAQSCRRMRVTIDTSFADVMRACGDPSRPHGWINRSFIEHYDALHRIGYAHSIEVRDAQGHLVGGLYGVRIGRFFAGESMFHIARDASKVALVALVDAMRTAEMALLDVQWTTPHLVSLGAVDIPREQYLALLARAVA